ncbi:MAG: pentapeptide repeat-containing protein [Methanosarcinales archaeon]|nr:pentapeptide repeat-containing protein [Methanosarcinales archaeon]
MVNEEHLNILNQGLEVWNEWREQNRQIQTRLKGADLINADMSEANLM